MAEMSCKEVFERLHDYLDRELTPEEIKLVERHLADCPMCAEEYAFEGSVLRHVKGLLSETDVPSDLFQRLRAALDAS